MNKFETCAARNMNRELEINAISQGCKARDEQERINKLKADFFANGGKIEKVSIHHRADHKNPYLFTSVTNKDRKGAQ